MKRSLMAGLVLLGLTWALSATAHAQYPGVGADFPDYNYLPAPELKTESLFAPVDISAYGSGPPRNEGFFGGYDWTYLTMSAPNRIQVPTYIAQPPVSPFPDLVPPDVTTSPFETQFSEGSRVDFGYICDGRGWLFSGSYFGGDTQSFSYTSETIFIDPDGNVIDNNLVYDVGNAMEGWSAELMRLWRLPRPIPPMPYDPVIEFGAGVRFLRFEEGFSNVLNSQFNLIVPDAIEETTAFFQNTTQAENNLVGPQVAIRYAQANGPFEVSAEARAMLAFNFASTRTAGRFSSFDGVFGVVDLPFNDRRYHNEVMPVAELRINAGYQLTRLIKFRMGWTGIYVGDGIYRASLVQQRPVGNELLLQPLNDEMFVQGVNIGFEINR